MSVTAARGFTAADTAAGIKENRAPCRPGAALDGVRGHRGGAAGGGRAPSGTEGREAGVTAGPAHGRESAVIRAALLTTAHVHENSEYAS
ncbi:hypothetical protein ACIRJR_33395 [Streptomyces sp. NPDC102402]|uniref:hypothetical protein n=1 Tax=Streptomyces sp. NPDC102402 TaxID=3366169 RepID=UPI00380E6DEC